MKTSTRRRVVAGAGTAVLAAALVAAAPLLSPPAKAADKIEASVRADLADDGNATFFVAFDQADLSAAAEQPTDTGRATAAFDSLQRHADDTQNRVRAMLDAAGATYEAFWIADTIKVTGGNAALVDALAERGEVTSILSEKTVPLDEPVAAQAVDAAADAPQWGVAKIGAPQAWSEFNADGRGIVIANVDSGVQYDHPALVGNYRGNTGNGTFDHNYNWYDPTGTCTTAPCDNNGHGTHTMGTMAGANGYGVAPGATWIAAKGCEARSCSDTSLLRAGQWILAPTDLNGKNPRPDLAPDIVNNSWGGGRGTTWYSTIIDSWRAAGIFPAFAAGNFGYGQCGTVDSPGDNQSAYTVGAFGPDGNVATFSGLGPSGIAEGKPDIAAPGVDVVSTVPGGGYAKMSGTSMATPHVAGAVAALWSASPQLAGDIPATAAALGAAATDKEDLRCGGTAARNGVYGEGLLDLYRAVKDAPRGNSGTITGTVTDKATGEPVAKVAVTADGPQNRATATDAQGHFKLSLVEGAYTLTTHLYGYADGSARTTVTADATATADVAITAVAQHKVTGTVVDPQNRTLPGAKVQIDNTPLDTAATDKKGAFTFPKVAEGTYRVTVVPADPALCLGVGHGDLVVDGDEKATFTVAYAVDTLGWHCEDTRTDWLKGRDTVALSGDEDAAAVALPFPVAFYNGTYTAVNATTNGLLNFTAPRLGDYENVELGAPYQPNGVIAAFWDDLVVDGRASVRTATYGTTGHRRFVIEWHDVRLADQPRSRFSFEVVFDETGGFILQYDDLDGDAERGAFATVGIEDVTGAVARQYSFDLPVLRDGVALRFLKTAQ